MVQCVINCVDQGTLGFNTCHAYLSIAYIDYGKYCGLLYGAA